MATFARQSSCKQVRVQHNSSKHLTYLKALGIKLYWNVHMLDIQPACSIVCCYGLHSALA